MPSDKPIIFARSADNKKYALREEFSYVLICYEFITFFSYLVLYLCVSIINIRYLMLLDSSYNNFLKYIRDLDNWITDSLCREKNIKNNIFFIEWKTLKTF